MHSTADPYFIIERGVYYLKIFYFVLSLNNINITDNDNHLNNTEVDDHNSNDNSQGKHSSVSRQK